MPSTRRQKAKARKSRELDMMSDLDNLDVMVTNGNDNPIERELADAIEQSSVQGDIEDNIHQTSVYRVIPEIQNIVSSMSSSGNRDTEASMSPGSQENRENTSGLKPKLTKKDSRSACDLRDTTGRGSPNTYGCKISKIERGSFSLVRFCTLL